MALTLFSMVMMLSGVSCAGWILLVTQWLERWCANPAAQVDPGGLAQVSLVIESKAAANHHHSNVIYMQKLNIFHMCRFYLLLISSK